MIAFLSNDGKVCIGAKKVGKKDFTTHKLSKV